MKKSILVNKVDPFKTMDYISYLEQDQIAGINYCYIDTYLNVSSIVQAKRKYWQELQDMEPILLKVFRLQVLVHSN